MERMHTRMDDFFEAQVTQNEVLTQVRIDTAVLPDIKASVQSNRERISSLEGTRNWIKGVSFFLATLITGVLARVFGGST
jgi:hypothetical protein